MSSKEDIPLHGPSVNIVRRCGATLTDVLQNKFGCVATIEGVDCEAAPPVAPQKSPISAPEKRFSIVLGFGIQVSVWKADLACVSMDAVANNANCSLQHRRGLAFALASAGGPQIQKESDDYIKKHGALSVGDAVVTDAGFLPCKKIIHVAGPEQPIQPDKNQVSQAEPFLRKAFWNIIKRAKENHLQTVVLPVLSYEVLNHPLAVCAHAIVTAVRQYCELPSRDHPKEILFVSHDDHTVKEMERACHLLLAPHLKFSQAAAAAAAASESKVHPKTSAPTVQTGNVYLTLKQGHIEDQQADVIVNSIRSRNLSVGQISNALLQKSGPGMQREMDIAPTTGNIIITHGYQLQCKSVYHTCCRGKGRGQMEQILFTSVLECLQLAVSHHHKSIAFPAVSTGDLGFGGKDVARVMSSAVSSFAQSFQKEMEVYCVISPSDNEMFKAFEEQMKHLGQKSDELNDPHDESRGGRASGPQISLSGPSDIATHEAEQWLRGLLFTSWKTLPICNNFISILDEHERMQLYSLVKNGTSIREVVERGRASMVVDGASSEDVVAVGLQVEALLCSIQNEFVREEEHSMRLMSGEDVSFKRAPVEFSPEFLDRASAFANTGLRIVKVERVENRTLGILFDLKKKQLRLTTSRKMFQRIPLQFCDMVSRIGFHAEYAPPTDPVYGDGIYFTSSVRKALDVWKDPHWGYLHFVEAEVLTGASTPGKPGLILPPPMVTDPRLTYDSVSGGSEISVIFCGHQTLPKYIITCTIER